MIREIRKVGGEGRRERILIAEETFTDVLQEIDLRETREKIMRESRGDNAITSNKK